MAYRIEYDSLNRKYEVQKYGNPSFPVMLTVCFGLFLLLTVLFWEDGRSALRSILIPGEDQKTLHAFRSLMEQLSVGESLAQAFASFCRELIQDAPNLY